MWISPVALNDPALERGPDANVVKVSGTLMDRRMSLPMGRG
jgi:hypothetical protein